jgi:hypothetical protein
LRTTRRCGELGAIAAAASGASAAAEEFEAWSRARLSVEQRESTRTEPLYHYTDETALRSIPGKQRLWCFCHEQQKDETEFEYAFDVARKVP